MSDLFHDDVPNEFIERVFDVMRRASQHEFQLLTKRASRMAELASSLRISENVWMA
jgi:protein gp37